MPDFPINAPEITDEFRTQWIMQGDDERAAALMLLKGSRLIPLLWADDLITTDEAIAALGSLKLDFEV